MTRAVEHPCRQCYVPRAREKCSVVTQHAEMAGLCTVVDLRSGYDTATFAGARTRLRRFAGHSRKVSVGQLELRAGLFQPRSEENPSSEQQHCFGHPTPVSEH